MRALSREQQPRGTKRERLGPQAGNVQTLLRLHREGWSEGFPEEAQSTVFPCMGRHTGVPTCSLHTESGGGVLWQEQGWGGLVPELEEVA